MRAVASAPVKPPIVRGGDGVPPSTPCDLTADRPWEWRATVAGSPRAWTPSLEEALAGLDTGNTPLPGWPTRWRAFYVPESGRPVLRARGPSATLWQPSPSDLAVVPSSWTMGDRTCSVRDVQARPDGLIDLAAALGSAYDTREAFLFAELDVGHAGPVHVHCGADYWMQWWIDGQPVFDTLAGGNRYDTLERAHTFTAHLAGGRHTLAVRVFSGSGGWALTSEALRPTSAAVPPPLSLESRRIFDVYDPAVFAGLTLLDSQGECYRLNGAAIPVPLAGMHYSSVAGIPSTLLRTGANVLTRAWSADACAAALPALRLRVFRVVGKARRPCVRAGLRAIPAAAAEIQTGPLLAKAGTDGATVTCRTTAPVPVRLTVGGRTFVSAPALCHRFDVAGLAADTRTEAWMTPAPAGAPVERGRRLSLRTLPVRAPFRFVVLGDVYPFDDTWSRVSEAALAAEPAWVVFTGDMVLQGREDGSWDPGFFAPAAKLFSSVPFFWVAGNHDERAPLLERLLPMPGAWEWVQRIGNVDLVGIDGAGEWSEGSPRYVWLERTLAAADAEYLFLFNHYSPWSSGPHAATDADGRPREVAVRTSREIVLPLAVRHGVTAVFSGHDHFYERSEVPGGPTVVVTGGAGSRLYDATGGRGQNPYSTCLRSEYHYCLLEVDGECCRMSVHALDGRCLDTREWTSRRQGKGKEER
jgi:hypothetical protein